MHCKFFHIALASLAITSMSLYSCASDEEDKTRHERKEIALDAATRSTANEICDFYVNFTNDMARYVDSDASSESKNVVVSPLSMSMTLGMIANGVDANAREDILGYLGTDNLQSLNHLCTILLAELPRADNLTDLKIANSLWVNNPYTLNNNFQSLMAGNFNVEVNYRDFSASPEKVVNSINDWCMRNTNRLISNFIDNIDPSIYAIFLNSMYFNAPWDNEPFSVENTVPSVFHGSKGDTTVDMMKSRESDGYCGADDDFEIFRLPFGNSSYNIYFVIPNESLSLQKASELLTPDRFMEMRMNSVLCPLTIYLPKFDVSSKYCMNNALAAAGLESLSSKLDLIMFDDDITGALELNQANSFRIDESGARAAAVTDGELTNELCPTPGKPYTVRVDRPFFFFIEEFSTNACIMSGRISDL